MGCRILKGWQHILKNDSTWVTEWSNCESQDIYSVAFILCRKDNELLHVKPFQNIIEEQRLATSIRTLKSSQKTISDEEFHKTWWDSQLLSSSATSRNLTRFLTSLFNQDLWKPSEILNLSSAEITGNLPILCLSELKSLWHLNSLFS